MPWDKETARQAAMKSAEVRRRKRDMTPEQRAKDRAAAASEEAMKDLIKASKGQEEFKDLEPAKQLDAIKAVLMYGIGKPPNAAPMKPDDPKPPDDGDVSLV